MWRPVSLSLPMTRWSWRRPTHGLRGGGRPSQSWSHKWQSSWQWVNHPEVKIWCINTIKANSKPSSPLSNICLGDLINGNPHDNGSYHQIYFVHDKKAVVETLRIISSLFRVGDHDGQWWCMTIYSAWKSSPVSVFCFFGRTGARTGPRKLQNSRTADQDWRKPVITGCNQSCTKYIKMRSK